MTTPSQLGTLRGKIDGLEEEILDTKKALAAAHEPADIAFLRQRLGALDKKEIVLREEKNILLQGQASGSSLGGLAVEGRVRKWGTNMVHVKIKGETTEPTLVQLYLAAGESDQSATSGHIFMDNLRTIMHGLPVDVPIMVCEGFHAVVQQTQLQRDLEDLSQAQFPAGAELLIWPDTHGWKSLKNRIWHFVAKKPIVIGTVTVQPLHHKMLNCFRYLAILTSA
ncbi:hypothetical protein WJX79_001963 [Trebouxia sp. C0005]